MSFSFTVERKSYSGTVTYSNGTLTGHELLIIFLLTEINLCESEKLSIGGYNYSPVGKYLDDPVAVKLIAEFTFPNITFHGDVPKVKELPDGAV